MWKEGKEGIGMGERDRGVVRERRFNELWGGRGLQVHT